MSTSGLAHLRPSVREPGPPGHDSHGVCWAAIFAGAVGAAVLSLVLLLLGTGIGFSAVSPWNNEGASATAVGFSAIVWMTLVQVLASVLGGYLAGRLRTKWVGLDRHETYFRDTAHGFLAWAVATLIAATLLSSAVGSIIGGGVRAGASVAGATATIAGAGAAAASAASNAPWFKSESNDPLAYFTDELFRSVPGLSCAPSSAAAAPAPSAEAARILVMGIKNGSLSTRDSQYLGDMVARHTGLAPEEAQKRVAETFAQVQQTLKDAKTQAQVATNAARKASVWLALWLVISLLIGAFTASWAATFGGRLRDGLNAARG
jgi:hypothetical protein